jgi:eukaryotic-like serine/threonine-protein kinase
MPFVENEHVVSWNEAMARFSDRTGRPSPAAWNAASYPAGQRDYPVSGVSWYEAAAYAAFAGKALPNIYEWFRAAAPEESASMIALSNYAQRGLLPVGRTGAVDRFGAHDMAGNVREWCFNGSGGQKFILGSSWSDPAYMFVRGQKLEPFDRSVLNGFRCVKRAGRPVDRNRLLDSIPAPSVDEGIPAEPSEEVFAATSRLYRRDRTDLQPLVESTTQSRNWRRETLCFPNGRGKDQLFAYLFLPLVSRPRYQCIVYVPSGDAFQAKFGADIQPAEYMIRSGRAMLYPIFWGTYDRFRGFPSDPENSGYPPPMFIREGLIHLTNELDLSLDYLKRRADIGQIGYMGASVGANFGPVLLSRETQFKAAVFLSGAMPRHFRVMPESNPVNFASHVTIPILMINGKYDSISTPQEQESMFQLLGTPIGRKKRVLVESGHSVSAPEVLNTAVRETLNWFDHFLGLP